MLCEASTIATSDGRPDGAQPAHDAGDPRVHDARRLSWAPLLVWWARVAARL